MGITKSDGGGAEDDLDEGEDEPVPRVATPGGNDDEEEKLDVKVAVISVLDGVDSVLDGVDWVLDRVVSVLKGVVSVLEGVVSVLDGVMLLLVFIAGGVIDVPPSELRGVTDAGCEVDGIPDVVVTTFSRLP